MDSYFDIRTEVSPQDQYFILAKVYRVVHALISNSFQGQVAVAFPSWVDHRFDEQGNIIQRGSLGDVLRVLGKRSASLCKLRYPSTLQTPISLNRN